MLLRISSHTDICKNRQIGRADKRNVCAECLRQMVLLVPLNCVGNGAEVRRTYLLPSDLWQQLLENGALSLD